MAEQTTRILLLVEDNPADADIVEEMLERISTERYEVQRAESLGEAMKKFEQYKVDVVLLDLRLPDSVGVQSVRAIRGVSGSTPIVVLTGTEDDELAFSCIAAGAQDYLCKGEIRPTGLRRAIGYSISRIREAQIRMLESTLEQYHLLSSGGSATGVTASLAGVGSLPERNPAEYPKLVGAYQKTLSIYMEHLVVKMAKPRELMEALITRLGDFRAGPRDLVDLHLAALDKMVKGDNHERDRSLAVEGRLMALEMMGLLVDYYRIGLRRRSMQESANEI